MSDKMKKIIIGGCISLGVAILSVFLFQQWRVYAEAVELVDQYEEITFPNIYLNGEDVSNMSEVEIEEVIRQQKELFLKREVVVKVDKEEFKTTLKEFEPTFSTEAEVLAEQLIAIGKDLSLLEQATQINEPLRYDFSYTYTVDEDKVKDFVSKIEEEVYVEKKEPTFTMTSYGKFKVEEGAKGYSLNAEGLYNELNQQLDKQLSEPVAIKMEPTVEEQAVDPKLLKSINSVVSTYTSSYNPGIARAQNVILGANKISNTLLMPGDEFSFEQKVSPVNAANGYVNATIFLNGEATDGIGGGICQISSTLYIATLRAGIIPTERRNHSLPVNYVPLGLDATMAENYIDYKFVNTLDYPVYINSYANNGRITVEFWSNEDALNGITYDPKSYVYNDGLAADSTLYGYDKAGNLVYEKFLHTSRYKPYKVAGE